MAKEVETKVLDIDKDAVVKRLMELGASEVQDTRLIVDWFRLPDTKEGEEPWFLRIRSNSEGEAEVTWKAKSEHVGVIRQHKEINFPISNPEGLADLFKEVGLENYAHQEKDRISWIYEEWRFDLDVYPGVPAFIEIEGKDEEHIKEAMSLLEVGGHKTWVDGERTLIQNVYGVNWYQMKF